MNSESKRKIYFTRNELYLVISFFVFILALLIFTFFAPNYYKGTEPVQIEITKGLTLSNVADSLYKKEIIPSKTNMKIAAFLYGAERKIKAGRYNIPNGLNYLQLVELLLEGAPIAEISVTIPEGIWQHEIARVLKESLAIDSSEVMELSKSKSFLNSLNLEVDNIEGYLLPETYFFYSNSTAEEVLRRLKNEMDKIFSRNDVIARMNELGMNKHQVLTLASIIDGESNLVNEFKIISGVYHNRLKKGMLLQADPTVQYLIRERKNKKVFFKDLEIDSKFNTYKYPGLPPAPINNPGKEAIIATLFPEKHNYYFFVADGQGGHNFSQNHNQHSENVARYREWRRNQKQSSQQ